MKTIAIGDIHGVSHWQMIISEESDADKIVLIGDYFDSLHVLGERQLQNFRNIIAYKKANSKKMELIIGNHDYHYLRDVNDRYSGFQIGYQYAIQEALHQAISEGLMKMCYVQDDLLFTHAGVTKTWCVNNDIDLQNIEQSINDRFTYKPKSFGFTSGNKRNIYGDEICQTPIWVRPSSLWEDRIDGYVHIVGHTCKSNMIVTDDVVLIDTLETSHEYLKIIDGKLFTKKLKI